MAFIFCSFGAGLTNNRTVVDGDGISVVLVAVHDEAAAIEAAKALSAEGAQFIEFCGAFSKDPNFANKIEALTQNKVPVGVVSFSEKSGQQVAALFNVKVA